MKPLPNKILVRPEFESQTPGGIIIPDKAKRQPSEGEVVAVGEGRTATGSVYDLGLKAGDHIIFQKFGGTELRVDGEKLLVLDEAEVLAVKG